jgi:hypothetical protein
MTMPNDQNNRPRFLQSAKGQVTLLIVAAIAVVFLSMVLHLLWNAWRDLASRVLAGPITHNNRRILGLSFCPKATAASSAFQGEPIKTKK